MEGRIIDIQHFCTQDGPGIRTTVFLKGCPLHCVWCHNPESQRANRELWFRRTRCLSCGACRRVCPWGDAHATLSDAALRGVRCVGCERCADVCTSGAIEPTGRTVEIDEVMYEILADADYYRNSGGGATLSGGEPLMQPDFAESLLTACRKQGIHTAVETSGQGTAEAVERLAHAADLLLWDVKVLDPLLYEKYTGGSLHRMMDNLHRAARTGVAIRLRALYIPDLHDNREAVERLAELADSIGVPVDCIPYHHLGDAKREQLGLSRATAFRMPEEGEMSRFAAAVESLRGEHSTKPNK